MEPQMERDVTEPVSQSDEQVDRIVRRLAELPDTPLAVHVDVFEAVHDALQDHLAGTEGVSR